MENEYIRVKEFPKGKKKLLEELERLIKAKRTFMIASLKNLPTKQFQEIKKRLIGKAEIKVVKKKIIEKVIERIERGAIKRMKDNICDSCALLFSELDPFALSSELANTKSPAKAKVGEVAEEDIIIEPGPTELTPGPAISELGSVGIKVSVEDGKISIKEPKVLVKAGETIKEKEANVLTKLGLTPYSVGLQPIVAYDSKIDEVYTEIKIDKKKTLRELNECASKAFALANAVGYICKETISLLIAKASAEESILSNLIKNDK